MAAEPEIAPFDEEDLVERSRRGDVQAFNAIVAAYQDRVFNLCLRMLASHEAAADAAQEAFLSAFRSVGTLRHGSLQSWLFRIASNACIDELRRRKRRPQTSLDAAADDEDGRPIDPADPDPGPEETAVRAETWRLLQAELLALPQDQRLAVILCDVEGLAYEEIAATMGTSVGTVKSRISRGRARLREALWRKPELLRELERPTRGT